MPNRITSRTVGTTPYIHPTPARFQVGQWVKKIDQGVTSMQVGTIFQITEIIAPWSSRGWGYAGRGNSGGGAWEYELELDTTSRFQVGDFVIKARDLRSGRVPISTVFRVAQVVEMISLDGLSHRVYRAASSQVGTTGVWEDEVEAYSESAATDAIANDGLNDWERELLRASNVGTPNTTITPTKATFRTGERVRIEIHGSGAMQRVFTQGYLLFNDNGEPYVKVHRNSWPEGGE
jgi:hypothetical protein